MNKSQKRDSTIIFLILLFVIIFFVISLKPQTADNLVKTEELAEQTEAEIIIEPKVILPGDPVFITIISTSTPTKVLWGGESVPVFEYKGRTRVFATVDFAEKKLTKLLTVKFANDQILTQEVKITPREKIELPLGIPEKLGGNTPEASKVLIDNLIRENKILNTVQTATSTFWTEAFGYPVKNVFVTDNYGYDRTTVGQTIPHKGTDLRAEIGTEVVSMNRGVVRVASLFTVYGKTVIIDHGLGVQTFYMHLSEINVSVGEVVERGKVIGLSGDTGYADAPHLHLSIRINGVSIDPMTFLTFFLK